MNSLTNMTSLSPVAAARILPRIEELATLSESTVGLTRQFASAEHRQANDLTALWMSEAGMQVHEDAIGNIIGRYTSASCDENAPAIIIGSHLDTVINAGKFDGMLGVVSGIACVESIHKEGIELPFAIEVIGFADEEGVRYQSTYLGSRAISGDFDDAVLNRTDKNGVTFVDALKAFTKHSVDIASAQRRRNEVHAYLELHIEQGPVLEKEDVPVGVVTGIAGANRMLVTLTGLAGHAGTVPMHLRQDALAAAAECITIIEAGCGQQERVVGTVGQIEAKPGAGNVIAGDVQFSVDIRAAEDCVRHDIVEHVMVKMHAACAKRRIKIDIDHVHEASSISCDSAIIDCMTTAIDQQGYGVVKLLSGAGHDAAAMKKLAPVGMLFVRCLGGISHHPDESVTEADAISGANALLGTVATLCLKTA